jgi:hypothetical protein
MSTSRKPITFDIGFIVGVLIFVFAFAYLDLPIKDPSLIPPAIEGITTVTGLLFALDGLLITRYYSDATSAWQKIRANLYVLALAIGSVFIGAAYIALLIGSPMVALRIAFIVFNISYLVVVVFVFHFIYFLDLPNLLKARRPKTQQ